MYLVFYSVHFSISSGPVPEDVNLAGLLRWGDYNSHWTEASCEVSASDPDSGQRTEDSQH